MNTDDPHLKCHLKSQIILHICLHHHVVVLKLRCRRSCHNANKICSIIYQFGNKVLPGLFLGYALYAGRIWKGDVLVADIKELETMDASEIYSQRLNAKEIIFPKENGNFIFPAGDGRIKLSGRDQELRTPTLIREHPIRGRKSRRFSWRIRRVSFTTSRLISGCWWSDKWFLVHVRKLHIPPSRRTQSQTLLAERRIIPYFTEIHWRLQIYSHEFGC